MPDTVCAALQSASPLMNGERLYGLSAIALKIPGYRDNSHINSSTVFRWITKGVKAQSGRVIRLEAVRLGTAWKTSVEAVSRFTSELTAASLPSPVPAPIPVTPSARGRAAARAHDELAAVLSAK